MRTARNIIITGAVVASTILFGFFQWLISSKMQIIVRDVEQHNDDIKRIDAHMIQCKKDCTVDLQQSIAMFNAKLDKGTQEFRDITKVLTRLETQMETLLANKREAEATAHLDETVTKIIAKTASKIFIEELK